MLPRRATDPPPAVSLLSGGWRSAVATVQSPRPADARVISVIDRNPAWAIEAAVTDVAKRAEVSASSVIRTCQRLGFSGFPDVKLTLARDLAREETPEFPRTLDGLSTAESILDAVTGHSAQAVSDVRTTVDTAAFESATQLLGSAKHVLVVGNGASRAPAVDCAYRFASIGVRTHHLSDSIAQHMSATRLEKDDACLVISHSGTTRETLLAAAAAKESGARVVAVTSYRTSPLSKIADLVLLAGGPEHGFRHEAIVSRLTHFVVIDALFVALALEGGQSDSAVVDRIGAVRSKHLLD